MWVAERKTEHVVAAKPVEGIPGPVEPLTISGGMKGLDAGRDHRLGLERLLIKLRSLVLAVAPSPQKTLAAHG